MENSNPTRVPRYPSATNRLPVTRSTPANYKIEVIGLLDESWSSWFGGLELRYDQDGNTQLIGTIQDQAALYGILLQFRDLGLPLISLRQMEIAP
jgi:hypothetical protein